MNIYAILGAIAALIGTHWFMYSAGQDACQRKADKAALEYREKEIKLLGELEDAKNKREIIYRDRVHTIQGINDPSGCLDTPFPAEFLHAIRSPQAKPKPDR